MLFGLLSMTTAVFGCTRTEFKMFLAETTTGCSKNYKTKCKNTPCPASQCEKYCADDADCAFYYTTADPTIGGVGKCILHKQCKMKDNKHSEAGNTYVGTCDEGLIVGVSFASLTSESRWQLDKDAIEAGLNQIGGASMIFTSADQDPAQQKADIDSLVDAGADVLIIVAHDANDLKAGLAEVKALGIPMIAYDRLITDAEVFYLTFDNVKVGELQAQAVYDEQMSGNYIFVKGSPSDPNAGFVHEGQLNVLQKYIDASTITVVAETFINGWSPSLAKTWIKNKLNTVTPDAVVVSNDGMAAAVIEALEEKSLTGVPVSGQDGDPAALNRVAKGTQTVSVWKDSRELGKAAAQIAVALAKGVDGEFMYGATEFESDGVTVNAVLMEPTAITADNLDVVVDAGWITKDDLCDGATSGYCSED